MWPVQPESPAAMAVGGKHGAWMAVAAKSCSVGAMEMLCGSTAHEKELLFAKTVAELLIQAQCCAGNFNLAGEAIIFCSSD
jgi:hypothetical protein